ncbi:ETS homologous factor-like isoform X2 [Ptychodera flava]|uniref:ETS homologous factor-like isoform X2 n=1 Tax=Ptychodera flava TaxID=63121 RepID=UPI00396A43A0
MPVDALVSFELHNILSPLTLLQHDTPWFDELRLLYDCQQMTSIDEATRDFSMDSYTFLIQDILSDIGVWSKEIHPDCYMWTVQDVLRFLYRVNQKLDLDNNIPELALESAIGGETLCNLSEEDFRNKFGKDADVIRGYLDCWKSVCVPEYRKSLPPSSCHDGTYTTLALRPHYNSCDTDRIPENVRMQAFPNPMAHGEVKTEVKEQPIKRKRGRPRKHRPETEMKKKKKILWKFLLEHLDGGEFKHCVRWINRSKGLFRFVSKEKETIAKQWGKEKGHKKIMTYQKMARAMRDYTKKNVMEKCRGKLHYKFRPEKINQI